MSSQTIDLEALKAGLSTRDLFAKSCLYRILSPLQLGGHTYKLVAPVLCTDALAVQVDDWLIEIKGGSTHPDLETECYYLGKDAIALPPRNLAVFSLWKEWPHTDTSPYWMELRQTAEHDTEEKVLYCAWIPARFEAPTG